ncbi:fibronectin type III domain-containing protein [Paracoccus marinaquae]
MLRKAQYWREWLAAHGVTTPVYLIPTPQFVRQAEPVQFAADGNYTRPSDEIHLHAWQQIDDGLGHMVKMFLTGAKSPDDPERAAVLQTHIDNAWAILTTYGCTGLGTTTVTAWPVASDPLSSPLPLPGPPAQPAAPTFSAITDTGATVSWVAPADGGSAITSYTMEWRPVGGSIATVTDITTLSEPLTGLTAETDYEARITAINALGSSTPSAWGAFETAATPSGPTPLLELTPTTYTGPTPSSGAWPAASGGYRTFTPGDPAPVVLPLALSGSVYVVMAVRKTSFSGGSILITSFNDGNYGDWPLYMIAANGNYGDYSTVIGLAVSGETTAGLGLNGTWAVIEGFVDGGSIARICANGGTDQASGSAGAGSLTTTNLYVCRNESSTGQVVDIAALRVYDDVPADRAAERTWVMGQAPENAFPDP